MLFSTLKKTLFITFMISTTSFLFAADDEIKIDEEINNVENTTELTQSSSRVNKDIEGYFAFLENYINCNVTIIIKDVDNSVIGKLQEIYKDGVLLETAFNSSIFIPKDSIAYIKISKTNKK